MYVHSLPRACQHQFTPGCVRACTRTRCAMGESVRAAQREHPRCMLHPCCIGHVASSAQHTARRCIRFGRVSGRVIGLDVPLWPVVRILYFTMAYCHVTHGMLACAVSLSVVCAMAYYGITGRVARSARLWRDPAQGTQSQLRGTGRTRPGTGRVLAGYWQAHALPCRRLQPTAHGTRRYRCRRVRGHTSPHCGHRCE